MGIVRRSTDLRGYSSALLLIFFLSFFGVLRNAHAASSTANLGVSAAVAQNCTVSTTTVGFGNYDPVVANASTALTATGSVAVKCTAGSTGVSIALDNGANYSSGRRMKSGSNYLTYELYEPATLPSTCASPYNSGTVWNSTNTVTPSGTWSATTAQTITVCGYVAGAQDVPVGSYSDTVVATVNF